MKIPIDITKLSPLITFVYKWWGRSIRFFGTESWDVLYDAHAQGQPVVVALWHDELMPISWCGTQTPLPYVLFVSQSKDGEIISRVMEGVGHATVRGSSSRGGVRALLKAKRIMQKENRIAVLTVDGPRGPRHQAKDGVIFLAQRAGARIVPIRAKCRSRKVFEKAWDKFQLPYPFSRVDIHVGHPLEVTTEKLDETQLASETERLNQALAALGQDF